MKKLLKTAVFVIVMCAGLRAGAYEFLMYDDLGVAYGMTRAGMVVEGNNLFFVDAYIYILPDCPYAGPGLFFWSEMFPSYWPMKLIIFEGDYYYDYCMEAYSVGTSAIKDVYWCNAKGSTGKTGLYFFH